MMKTTDGNPRRLTIAGRVAWTVATLAIAEVVVCGVSALPVLAIWSYLFTVTAPHPVLRVVVFSAAAVPSYIAFALCLTIVSPVAIRTLRWHTPPDRDMRIADMGWPLLRWVRYAASIHVARVLAGTLFRGSPIWTLHLRLNGARLGTQVYVNSLSVSDYNLLECGDDVVIGGATNRCGAVDPPIALSRVYSRLANCAWCLAQNALPLRSVSASVLENHITQRGSSQ